MSDYFKEINSGVIVEVLTSATTTKGKPKLLVVYIDGNGRAWAEEDKEFNMKFRPISDVDADEQLKGIDFIA